MPHRSAPPPPSEARVPMRLRIDSWAFVNQQDLSPLFNGRIPGEIRNLIFEFTLAESTVPVPDRPISFDFFARDDHGKLDDDPFDDLESRPSGSSRGSTSSMEAETQMLSHQSGPAPPVQAPSVSAFLRQAEVVNSWDWFRPGYAGQRKVYTALLQTCRLAYRETYTFPSQSTKIFYSNRGPKWCPQSPSQYVSGLAPAAAKQLRNLHIFSQMWFLERDLMDMVTGIFSAYERREANGHLVPFSNPRTQPQMHLIGPFSVIPPAFPWGAVAAPAPRPRRRLPVLPPVSAYPTGFVGPALWRASPARATSIPTGAAALRPWRVTEHMTSLRIYLRRTDWWDWETNSPLVINPFSPSPRSTLQQMQQSMRTMQQADRLLDPRLRLSTPSTVQNWGNWGLLFLRMPELQTLTIDFETSEDKKSEMKTIVAWAHQHWRFPTLRWLSGTESDPYTFSHLQSSYARSPVDLSPFSRDLDALCAADAPVQESSWRGLPHHFANRCPACGSAWHDEPPPNGCLECDKMKALRGLGKGPQLFVWTVTWDRKVPPRDAVRDQSHRDTPGARPSSESLVQARPRRELDELIITEVAF